MRLFSRITGWVFTSAGAIITIAFLDSLVVRGPGRSFTLDLQTVLVMGLLPLFGGVLLLMRRYRLLRSIMGWACGGFLALSVLTGAVYFALGRDAPKPIGWLAASGLVGALLSAAIGLVAALRCRATRAPAGDETDRSRAALGSSAGNSSSATWQRHVIFNVIGLAIAGFFTISLFGMIKGRFQESLILRAGLIILLVGLGSLVNLAERRLIAWSTICMIAGYFIGMFLAPLGIWGIVELAQQKARHRRRRSPSRYPAPDSLSGHGEGKAR